MDLLIWIAVIIGGLFVAGWILSAMAKTQKNVVVRATPAAIAETIDGHFAKLWWPPVAGRGQFNFRARGFGLGGILKGKPTLSIDLAPTPDGATEVQVWMSEWGQQSGIVALADRFVLKRSALFRKLRTLEAAAHSG